MALIHLQSKTSNRMMTGAQPASCRSKSLPAQGIEEWELRARNQKPI